MRYTLAVLLLAAGLAGCLADQETGSENASPADVNEDPARKAARQAHEASVADQVDAGWASKALPHGEEHDHAAAEDHRRLSTPNLRVRSYDPLTTNYHDATSGDYFCGGKAELGNRTITVTHSFETDVALVVVDVSDPDDPRKLGELGLPNTHVWDVSVTDDGSYAILGVTPNEVPPENDSARDRHAHGSHVHGDGLDEQVTRPPIDGRDPRLSPAARDVDPDEVGTVTMQPTWHDGCGNTYQGPETQVPYVAGGVLVDLSNLTQPRVADYVPQPLYGGHSVVANTIDGTHYVLVATTNLQHQASYFSFYTIQEMPPTGRPGAQLEPYGTLSSAYPVPESPQRLALFNGHVDGWMAKHPEMGDVMAYLANNNGGFVAARLAGPGQVEPVGTWNDYDRNAPYGQTGAIHTARPLGVHDGRHLTLVGQELTTRAENRPTGELILVDTTDPADPTPVARWTLPADVEWNGTLMFSTHYVALDGQTMYVALWHGGVWVTDIGSEHWPELPTKAAFVPALQSPDPPPPHLGSFVPYEPTVLDVFSLGNGTFATFDGPSGVYVVDYEPTGEVPEPEPWTRDAWIDAS